jgi:dihydroxy-acid dehydratase
MTVARALRSNFEAGTVREAARRAQWKALGLTDADIEKPKIAVVNSSSELAICFRHLDGVAAIVKEAVWAAGGLPFEIRTAAPSDFIISAGGSGGYILPSRDLVVNDMEMGLGAAMALPLAPGLAADVSTAPTTALLAVSFLALGASALGFLT